ncbi:MAG: hypothetical protein LBV75_03330 [Paludibacter sp.]|jgi:magnesium-transporting ATPase (P-type)|nr:hypothetical protein [Paludibacter sp.]
MKTYYYFLFRIYKYYKDKENDTEWQALFGVTAVSSTVIGFLIMSFYAVLTYFDVIPMFFTEYNILILAVLIMLLNYRLFIKNKKFLNFGFIKSKKGTITITLVIIAIGIQFVIIANLNRQKIFSNRKAKYSTEQPIKQNSLESKLRDWWNN